MAVISKSALQEGNCGQVVGAGDCHSLCPCLTSERALRRLGDRAGISFRTSAVSAEAQDLRAGLGRGGGGTRKSHVAVTYDVEQEFGRCGALETKGTVCCERGVAGDAQCTAARRAEDCIVVACTETRGASDETERGNRDDRAPQDTNRVREVVVRIVENVRAGHEIPGGPCFNAGGRAGEFGVYRPSGVASDKEVEEVGCGGAVAGKVQGGRPVDHQISADVGALQPYIGDVQRAVEVERGGRVDADHFDGCIGVHRNDGTGRVENGHFGLGGHGAAGPIGAVVPRS